jgi:hypothetical protein
MPRSLTDASGACVACIAQAEKRKAHVGHASTCPKRSKSDEASSSGQFVRFGTSTGKIKAPAVLTATTQLTLFGGVAGTSSSSEPPAIATSDPTTITAHSTSEVVPMATPPDDVPNSAPAEPTAAQVAARLAATEVRIKKRIDNASTFNKSHAIAPPLVAAAIRATNDHVQALQHARSAEMWKPRGVLPEIVLWKAKEKAGFNRVGRFVGLGGSMY